MDVGEHKVSASLRDEVLSRSLMFLVGINLTGTILPVVRGIMTLEL